MRRSRLVCFKPQVEAGRRMNVEYAHHGVTMVRKGMRDARWDEDECSRAGDDLRLLEYEGELSFEDVERVVFGGVSVHGRAFAVRLDCDNGQIEAPCVLAACQELDVSDTVASVRRNYERVPRSHPT